ncbi:MAG: HEAT repeat domain-containing protein [Pirellulaceae bacterium]|nr:HEAT repeat domain-containing protein [Pirellulaceae bacterium]
MSRIHRQLLAVVPGVMLIALAGCNGSSGPVRQIELRPQPSGDVQPASFVSAEAPGLLPPISAAPLAGETRPFSEWTEQQAAADALARIGAPAVPRLAQLLGHADAEVRLQAATVLGRMGPDAQGAAIALTQLLADPDIRIRKAATRALGRIGPAAGDEAVAALMLSLEQGQPVAPTTEAPPAEVTPQ